MTKQKIYNGVNITLVKNHTEMSKIAARIILYEIKNSQSKNKNKNKKKKFSLLLPTGTTPKGIYKILSQQPKNNFSHVQFFNLDEYCIKRGKELTMIEPIDKRSYRYFMHRNLFDKIGEVAHYFPTIENVKNEGIYDQFIKKMGGIDLCLNAMGENGHTLGFNSPGTNFTSKTRLVKIDQNTKLVNKKLTDQNIPNYAITTGIQTGMKAKKIVFIVSGKRKASILKKVIYGPITKEVPASVLRKHNNCIWIVDQDAASML